MAKELGDFQTPPALVLDILQCLNVNGKNWKRVFEPTCGAGNFISGLLQLQVPPCEIQAIEFDSEYFYKAKEKVKLIAQKHFSTRVIIQQAKIFDFDLRNQLNWSESGSLLVIGNPPWVTNSQLGALESDNLPEKRNLKGLKGIEALTGHSNFDIAEYIWIKLLQELADEKPTIALLCKTSVARNILQFAFDNRLNINNASIRMIDAQKWFRASVSACLFSIDVGAEKVCYDANVYQDLYSNEVKSVIGIIGGKLVADIQTYKKSIFIEGKCSLTWRQGVKHDAISVMELDNIGDEKFKNKLGQIFKVELDYVYPLLKSTDLFHGKIDAKRGVIITQKKVGEDTSKLQIIAPLLWNYLDTNLDFFNKRKSSIYKGKPLFSIFGIGDYSFSLYKVAISGLHKEQRFRVLSPINNRPVMLDDTCYFVPCESLEQANYIANLLNSSVCLDFIKARTFKDAKRPITKKLLQCINIEALHDFCHEKKLIF